MSNLIPVSDVERMAGAIAKSGLFGVKQPEQALALMLIAQAEGLHPAIAARDYHIIQGRPALKADAMLARFQANGGRVKWLELSDAVAEAEFSHPAGGTVSIAWSIEMAKRAGLTKNQTWSQYPRAMLRARCISEGIRTVFPGVVVGTYTPEEVADMAVTERDMGPAVVVEPKSPPVDISQELLDSLMFRITTAETMADLEALRPELRGLVGEAKTLIFAAAKNRADEIKNLEQV
jgi:hypothetical protein